MKPRRSTSRRLFIFLLVMFVLYSVVGFVVAPPVLKDQLVKRLAVELGRPARITRIQVNPWTLSVTIEGLAISDPDMSPFVGWDRLYVNFDPTSFFVKEWRFQEITAAGPAARVVVNKDGTLNFTDLVKKFSAESKPPSKPMWPLRVGKLVVTGAQLDFADHSRGEEFKTHAGPVNFSLIQFHTAPNRDAPYEFTASTESGEKLRWLGTVSVSPLGSEGELAVRQIPLAKYAPYYHDVLQFDILSGLLDVTGRYRAGVKEDGPFAQLSGGHVHLTAFKAAQRASTAPVLQLDDFDISGLSADAVTMTVQAERIALAGGRATVRREKDGSIDLLTMLTPRLPASTTPGSTGPATAPPKTAPKPKLDVGTISVRQFAATFEDHVPVRVATQTLENADIDVQKFTLTEAAAIPVHAALTLTNHGAVTIDGSVKLTPLQATLAVDVTNVGLSTVTPYIEPMANVRITQGTVWAKGDARFALVDGASPEITYKGDAKLAQFNVEDGVGHEPLTGWSELSLNGMEFTASPLALTISEVVWNQPKASVIINANQTINLLEVLQGAKDKDAATPVVTVPPPAADGTAKAPKIEVARVTVNDGAFTFTDRSVKPEVHTAITHFSGNITGLSSENPGRGIVKMQATVDGSGPLAVTGKLDPLGPKKSVDVQVDLKDVELTPFSPYTGKFAGYELSRGKLFLDITAQLADRKLDMKNAVTLSNFTLGAPTQSPDATKLPVRLAVALLKDNDGKIVLDVPVQGSLDDPQFKIAGVVWHVIGNILTKVAVSPFSLLGAMFGGGGDELAFQDFVAGEAQLAPGNLPKLETLTKALQARPAVNLEIDGSFDPAADVAALKQKRMARSLRSALWDDRRQTDANIPPPEQMVVTPEDENAMVRKLYAQKFPLGTTLKVPLTAPEPVALPPPAEPPPEKREKKGIFRRATDVVTLKAWRERRAERKHPEPAPPAPAPLPTPSVPDTNAAAAAAPSLEEMKARLADTIEITDGDLRRLAAARAQLVRDYFVQQKISAERLFLANVENQGKGAKVFLQLQ